MKSFTKNVDIPIGEISVQGILNIPEHATSIVIFVHGSGSSRFSTRNQYVAGILNDANIATLLFDLLTPDEDHVDEITREYRFNIDLLSQRLQAVTDWIRENPNTKKLAIGYFGASTGAGAALKAAAIKPLVIKAVVSRGGRPDLAEAELAHVKAPTLLIVGELDETVIELNKQAIAEMHCEVTLSIIPGATHLFEEPATLKSAAILATEWFVEKFNDR